MGRLRITEAMVDAEMVGRGWARVYGSGWGDGAVTHRVGAKIPADVSPTDRAWLDAEYRTRRAKVRQDLINAARGSRETNGDLDDAEDRARYYLGKGMGIRAASEAACGDLARDGINISPNSIMSRLRRRK